MFLKTCWASDNGAVLDVHEPDLAAAMSTIFCN